MAGSLDVVRLRAALLTARGPWRDVEHHATIGSTNARAAFLGRPWQVVVADHQSEGRGRMTRTWEAPPGTSVAVSATVPVPATGQGWLPLAAGLAVRAAVEQTTGLRAALKWPNDVLLMGDGDRKVCGILCEVVTGDEGEFVVVGAGINVDQHRADLPVDTATSLALAGAEAVDRTDLVVAYLSELAGRYATLTDPQTGAGLWADYRDHCATIGRTVTISTADGGEAVGAAESVDDAGRLLLVDATGERRAWAAGDVVHARTLAARRDDWTGSSLGRTPAGWHDAGMSPTPPAGAAGGPDDGARIDLDEVTAALLSRPLALNRRDVSREAHVDQQSARRFWQALGFPLVTSDESLFTAADVDALEIIAELVRDGDLDEPSALQLTRAFARTADRLSSWQVQLVAEAIGHRQDNTGTAEIDHPRPATARATTAFLVEHSADLESLLVYAWRRHLADAVSRLLTDAEPMTDEGVWRHVGFADLVDFSALVRQSTEHQLARIVRHFEALTADVVSAHGGRIVKTVGDAILFANQRPAAAAATALDLVEAIGHDQVLPDVRAGVAAGRVVLRLGDIFGTTVNRASRLTTIAHPHTVLVDRSMAEELHEVPGFELTPMRARTLHGVGRVQPYVLARAGSRLGKESP